MGNLSNIIRNILWKKKEKRSSALRRQSEQTYKNNENRQEKKVERPSTTGRKNGEKNIKSVGAYPRVRPTFFPKPRVFSKMLIFAKSKLLL